MNCNVQKSMSISAWTCVGFAMHHNHDLRARSRLCTPVQAAMPKCPHSDESNKKASPPEPAAPIKPKMEEPGTEMTEEELAAAAVETKRIQHNARVRFDRTFKSNLSKCRLGNPDPLDATVEL